MAGDGGNRDPQDPKARRSPQAPRSSDRQAVSRRAFTRTGVTGVAAMVVSGWRIGDVAAAAAARQGSAGDDPAGAAASEGRGDGGSAPIDRHALVARHTVVRTASNPDTPLQVGNGRLAFGADITGLQTFVPFATMSDWGWHEDPLPPDERLSDYAGQTWDTHGRPVRYAMPDPDHPAISQWLIANPNRVNLGRVGLVLLRADGTEATEADLGDRHQELDLWTGILHSRFTLDGVPVTVTTSCDPDRDAVAVRIDSALVADGRLAVFLDFPYATGEQKFSAPYVGVWDRPEAHTTRLHTRGPGHADLTHTLDGATYHVGLAWQGAETWERDPDGTRPHRYVLGGRAASAPDAPSPASSAVSHHIELTCLFTPGAGMPGAGDEGDEVPADGEQAPPASAVAASSARAWPAFWQSGGAVDLSGSTDPRWRELERRIVVSQYLMAVNEAGATPPQESGLVNNGWYGKFHMEMYWWHAAHQALWRRWPLLDRSTGVYGTFLESSRRRAARQGYRGARWPKMTDPSGRMAPGEINALLIWQQPHPVFLAELDYRAHPTPETLHRWRDVVFATADFMASYAYRESGTGSGAESDRYVLGPPMHLVSENSKPKVTVNGAFELSYWRFGLRVAQEWRRRLGLPADPDWAAVRAGLAELPVQDGVYVAYEGVEDMWTAYLFDHPALVGLYGWLPGDGVDTATVRATAHRIWDVWAWDSAWGWDFPMLAMNAARIGEQDRAVDFLLHDNFAFDDAGYPIGGSRVPTPYFPGSGGLLYAVAMMAAGWDDGAEGGGEDDTDHATAASRAPGFPSDGTWLVRWEGLGRAI